MVKVINISGGNLHIYDMGVEMTPGAKLDFDMTKDELFAKYPELSLFLDRKRIMIHEDEKLKEKLVVKKIVPATARVEDTVEQVSVEVDKLEKEVEDELKPE